MKVLARVAKALDSAQFVMDTAPSTKECLQLTRFGHHSGVLVVSDSLIFQDVVVLVKLLRQQNPETSIFVLAGYLDLDQRFQLFEAGVDDCVREPYFTSELGVRLAHSIHLRQVASDRVASN